MSKKYGKTLDLDIPEGFECKIRWNRELQKYLFTVPECFGGIVEISQYDLERLIEADLYDNFIFENEKGELDDDTYRGVSWLQAHFYVTKNSYTIAKREWKKNNKYPKWVALKKRIPRGGRPRGFKVVDPEEIERMEYLVANYDSIVSECVRKDWYQEYMQLNQDINKYKGVRVSKRALHEKFVELRKQLSL